MEKISMLLVLQLLPNCSANSNLVEKAVIISKKYYKHHFATTVVWKPNESDCIDEFVNIFRGSVVLRPLCDGYEDTIRDFNAAVGFEQTVFFASNFHDYEQFIKIINDIIRFPILFILVLEKSVDNPADLITYIKVTWDNDQGDIVIISANKADEVTLSTFYPYSNEKCKNYEPVTLQLEDNMFPNKFENYHQCPIRVTLLQLIPKVKVIKNNGTATTVGGHDGSIFMTILDKLNATLDITSVDSHNTYGTYVNGTVTGYLGDLTSDKADILIPSGVLTHSRYSVAFASHIYHTIDIRWIGPKRRQIFDWLIILIPDKTHVTPLIGLAFASFVSVAIIIKRLKRHLTRTENSIVFQSFIIFLGQSTKFVTKSSLLNSVFGLWIWCSFIIRIDYQGDLYEGMQRISLEKPFTTVDEAITRVDGYGGVEIFHDFFKNTHIAENYKTVPLLESNEYIQRVFEGERFLLVTDMVTVPQANHDIQILNDMKRSANTCYYMRPGWPAAKNVDQIILSLVEGGFIEYLLSKVNREWKFKRNKDEEIKPKTLSTAMLSTCFYGLAIMWAICSFILVMEIIYYNY